MLLGTLAMAQKYGDVGALQAIQQNMLRSGQPMPNVGGIDITRAAAPDKTTGEIKQVEDARAKARSASEVS